MEFDDVSEKVEWEARRVAAAFAIKEWEHRGQGNDAVFLATRVRDFIISCDINKQGQADLLSIDNAENPVLGCTLCQSDWMPCEEHPSYNELMIRALYRLGREEVLPAPIWCHLSAHQKLELRLSMPREFWPQKWLDEKEKGE